MASYILPPIYAAFVWWFSTGAVLLIVARSNRFASLCAFAAIGLLVASLSGLAFTANDTSVAGAFTAFTSTILLWGAQEIAFLAGWLTGPRPYPCPAGAQRGRQLGFALQAILYHEFALLACGAAIVALTSSGPNRVGIWTFLALWALRQSAKINLFLGVPVTNEELMPDAVRYLKTYFARKPVSAFFPISVTLAVTVLVIMLQRLVEVAVTPFDVVGLTLVSSLFALGVIEHWFMLLPMPAIKLWGWGMSPRVSLEGTVMEQGPTMMNVSGLPSRCASPQASDQLSDSPEARGALPQFVVLAKIRNEIEPAKARGASAKQRLEDEFRQRFLAQRAKAALVSDDRDTTSAEQIVTVNGRVP